MRTHSAFAEEKCKLLALPRSTFKELVGFVSPAHCSEAKTIIEEHFLFSLLEKK